MRIRAARYIRSILPRKIASGEPSATTLDSLFTPGVKDPRAHEANVSFANDFGDGVFLSMQAYWRKDSKILEDYDFGLYFEAVQNMPFYAHLGLDPVEDFGYGSADEVPLAMAHARRLVELGGSRALLGRVRRSVEGPSDSSLLLARHSPLRGDAALDRRSMGSRWT